MSTCAIYYDSDTSNVAYTQIDKDGIDEEQAAANAAMLNLSCMFSDVEYTADDIYIIDGEVFERQAIGAAYSKGYITNLPLCTIRIVSAPVEVEPNVFQVTDGSIELEFEIPGAYRLVITPDSKQYRPQTLEVAV